LDIEPPFDREQLRSRYLTLVKKHHPDVNQGDPLAEDRLKDINEAYKILQKALNA
jgi:curved DNA-binding protein CbpA